MPLDFEFAEKENKTEIFETKTRSYYNDVFHRFLRNKSSVVALITLIIIILLSIFGPLMTKNSPYDTNSRLSLLPPKMPLLEKIGIFDGTKKYERVYVEYIKDSSLVDYNNSYYEEYFFRDFITKMSKEYQDISEGIIYTYVDIEYDLYEALRAPYIKKSVSVTEKETLDKKNCIIEIVKIHESTKGEKYQRFDLLVDPCIEYGYGNNGPYYYFGTNVVGQDLWSRIWLGTRVSLLIGLCVAVVTLTIGVLWGAISGFYGGKVDIIMERFTEVLGGIPWIVIMTLTVLYLGSNVRSLAIALVLTSWIGTSSMVRAQMYRYKNREYVLASKTLGAKDSRLIFKHILPNALGTIVTASVLIIPSSIFMEATISYLGLGISGISIGNLLSNGQSIGIVSYPYLTLFPAIIISVLMISFNMFGNGLRDALNPSLRGTI